MLEILAIAALCKTNKKNALARGRKGGLFVAITIILWVLFEIIGSIIGFSLAINSSSQSEYMPYIIALAFAGLGGLISYLIAKNVPMGNYVDPKQAAVNNIMQNAQPLNVPAHIIITREKSFVASLASFKFKLNGQEIGSLSNGSQMTVTTNVRQNVLEACAASGAIKDPFLFFDVTDGGTAEIFFKSAQFLAERSRGIFQPTPPPAPMYQTPPVNYPNA